MPSSPAASPERGCKQFDLMTVSAQNIRGGWKVVAVNDTLIGNIGPVNSQVNAQKAVDIIKHYKFAYQCSIGRPPYQMQYFLVSDGKPPTGTFSVAGQYCQSFNPATAIVYSRQDQGGPRVWGVAEPRKLGILYFHTNRDDANKALNIIKKYGFSQQCIFGNEAPNIPITYFLSGPNTSAAGGPVAK